jgi:hypothetical protein
MEDKTMANISTAQLKITLFMGKEKITDIFTRHPQFGALFAALSYHNHQGGDSMDTFLTGYTPEEAQTPQPIEALSENRCTLSGRWNVAENFSFYRGDTRRLMRELKALGYDRLSADFWDIEPGEETVTYGRLGLSFSGDSYVLERTQAGSSYLCMAERFGLAYPDPEEYRMSGVGDEFDDEKLNQAQDKFEASLWDALTRVSPEQLDLQACQKETSAVPLKENTPG